MGEVPTLATDAPIDAEHSTRINPLVISALLLAFLAIIVALYAVFGDPFSSPEQPQAQVQPTTTPKQHAPAAQSTTAPVSRQSERLPQSTAMAQSGSTSSRRSETSVKSQAVQSPMETGQKITEQEVVVAAIKPPPARPKQRPDIESQPRTPAGGQVTEQALRTVTEQPGLSVERPPSVADTADQPTPTPPAVQRQPRQELLDDLRRQFLELSEEANKTEADQAQPGQPAVTAKSSPEALPEQRKPPAIDTSTAAPDASSKPRPISENELPYDVYQRLPKRKVNALAYSKDPQRRFVLLNSKKMREGDGTEDGLVVEQILRSGIIFRFEGHRFFTAL